MFMTSYFQTTCSFFRQSQWKAENCLIYEGTKSTPQKVFKPIKIQSFHNDFTTCPTPWFIISNLWPLPPWSHYPWPCLCYVPALAPILSPNTQCGAWSSAVHLSCSSRWSNRAPSSGWIPVKLKVRPERRWTVYVTTSMCDINTTIYINYTITASFKAWCGN